MMEKNAKAKKLLYFGLGPDEYTRISECESPKYIWDALQVAYEGTNQVKQSLSCSCENMSCLRWVIVKQSWKCIHGSLT